jgi:hypothetical protein
VHSPESPWDTAVRHSAAGFRVVCHPCGKLHVRDLCVPDWYGTLTSHVWTRGHHGRYKFHVCSLHGAPQTKIWEGQASCAPQKKDLPIPSEYLGRRNKR